MTAPSQTIVNFGIVVNMPDGADVTDVARELAQLLDRRADHQFGRPLTYRDPTGDQATWNALVDAVEGVLRGDSE